MVLTCAAEAGREENRQRLAGRAAQCRYRGGLPPEDAGLDHGNGQVRGLLAPRGISGERAGHGVGSHTGR